MPGDLERLPVLVLPAAPVAGPAAVAAELLHRVREELRPRRDLTGRVGKRTGRTGSGWGGEVRPAYLAAARSWLSDHCH